MAWVFNGGDVPVFPSGVFVEFEVARAWVWRSRLSCTLTHYAVDVGAYDWSVASGWFTPTKPEQVEAPFIERYGGGAEHDHYTDGGSDPTTEQRVPPPLGFRPAAGLGRCRSRGPHGVAVQRAPPGRGGSSCPAACSSR